MPYALGGSPAGTGRAVPPAARAGGRPVSAEHTAQGAAINTARRGWCARSTAEINPPKGKASLALTASR
jgi:hypothetical protein